MTSHAGKDAYLCRIDFVDDYGGLGGAECGDTIVVRADQVYGIDNTWRFSCLEIGSGSEPMLAYHKTGMLIGFRNAGDGKCSIKAENFAKCVASGVLGNSPKAQHAKFKKLAKQSMEYRQQLLRGRFSANTMDEDEDDAEESGSNYY